MRRGFDIRELLYVDHLDEVHLLLIIIINCVVMRLVAVAAVNMYLIYYEIYL